MTNTLNNTSGNQLTRQQLELINRRTIQYPLQIAEKDYYLALAIQLVADSSLKEKLVFKGGTALHHCYLPQKRFSEDLDFTSTDPKITIAEIQNVLETTGVFKINKVYQSDFTIKIERLQYQGVLGQPGNIKFEVDIHQNVVLPPIAVPYQNVWGVEASPIAMDSLEITAEKIRATAQRARYRDYYDLYFLMTDLKMDIKSALKLVRQKEVRSQITAENIRNNWGVAKEQMKRDLASIYCSEEISYQSIENLISKIQFKDINPIN